MQSCRSWAEIQPVLAAGLLLVHRLVPVGLYQKKIKRLYNGSGRRWRT